MSLGGILLGLINVVIVVMLLVLIGAIAQWILSALGWPPPEIVVKLYLAIVALVALYLLAALVLGIPSVRLIGGWQSQVPAITATIPAAPDITTGTR